MLVMSSLVDGDRATLTDITGPRGPAQWVGNLLSGDVCLVLATMTRPDGVEAVELFVLTSSGIIGRQYAGAFMRP